MRDIIIDPQESNTWKVQLKIAIQFISSKDAEEERVIHSRCDNIKFTSYNDANIDSLISRYQVNLEAPVEGS